MQFMHPLLYTLLSLTAVVLPSVAHSQSDRITRILAVEGSIPDWIDGKRFVIDKRSYADRLAILTTCEKYLDPLWQYVEPTARAKGLETNYTAKNIASMLATAVGRMQRFAPTSDDNQTLLDFESRFRGVESHFNPAEPVFSCFLTQAVRIDRLGPQSVAQGGTSSTAQKATVPKSQPAPRSAVASAPVPEPPQSQGRTLPSFKDSRGNLEALGPKGMAAVAEVLRKRPERTSAQVTAERRSTQMQVERANFEKTRSRVVHNRANDASACMKVEPTGVVAEWGIEGRFRLVNSCSYPVEASWCANAAECSSGRGSTWTIRAGGNYPIFFADAENPSIGVGACKAGDAKQPPLGLQPGISRTGFSEARDLPQAAPGVNLLDNHRCE